MQRKVFGFTLIELIIVIAIIAIIATIAIPGLLRARMSANEGSAAATLRSIASSQQVFAKSSSVDQDEDNVGEFGVFNELTGATNRRATPAIPLGRPRLKVSDLTISLKAGNAAVKSGYVFQMFLPGPPAGVITDNLVALPLPPLDKSVNNNEAAINQQENVWICYAWPYAFKSSGVRAFVCNQTAEVYKSKNLNPVTNLGYWYGDGNRPNYNSAMTRVGGDPTFTVWTTIHTRDNTPANIIDPNHIWLPVGS